MRAVRSKHTGLEQAMEHVLRSASLRFRCQPDLPGHPDFALRDSKVLVFCDSAFWHGKRSAETSGRAFRRNRSLWMQKLQATVCRDARVSRQLRRQGWSVWRFSDTDILKRPARVASMLRYALSRYHE